MCPARTDVYRPTTSYRTVSWDRSTPPDPGPRCSRRGITRPVTGRPVAGLPSTHAGRSRRSAGWCTVDTCARSGPGDPFSCTDADHRSRPCRDLGNGADLMPRTPDRPRLNRKRRSLLPAEVPSRAVRHSRLARLSRPPPWASATENTPGRRRGQPHGAHCTLGHQAAHARGPRRWTLPRVSAGETPNPQQHPRRNEGRKRPHNQRFTTEQFWHVWWGRRLCWSR